jgi:peptidyl-prolyl cis-trans isomerase C
MIPRILSVSVLVFASACFVSCKKDARVLAKVNDSEVTQERFDAYLDFKRIPANDEKRRDGALDEYLDRAALAAVIEKQGRIDAKRVEVEVDEFRKEMLVSRYFDEFLDEKVTDEAVKNYFEAHAKDYEQRKVHVAHVLIRTHGRMDEVQRKAKLSTAQEAFSKIQSGTPFAEVAQQYSEDRISGSKGGDLGWIKEGTIDARFSQRAFEVKAGTVTEPFETPFGYHILKVIEEPTVVRRPFSAVAGDIRYQLRNEAKDAELKRLKGLVKIEKKQPYVLDPNRPKDKSQPKAREVAAPSANGKAFPPSAAPSTQLPPSQLGASEAPSPSVGSAKPEVAPKPAAPVAGAATAPKGPSASPAATPPAAKAPAAKAPAVTPPVATPPASPAAPPAEP